MGICTYQVAIKERVRGRENLHVYGYQIYALSFSQIQEAIFLSPNTQIQWRRAKDPQANKILKEKARQIVFLIIFFLCCGLEGLLTVKSAIGDESNIILKPIQA